MQAWTRMLVRVVWSSLFLWALLQVNAQTVASLPADAVQHSESELPDSPGVVAARSAQALNTRDAVAQSTAQSPAGSGNSGSQDGQSRPQPPPTQLLPQKPTGTAAAESPDTSGIAASEPAGVAIAPAKQRRTRILVLKIGALVGAGVAVGSVVALTAATPSKPPGAH